MGARSLDKLDRGEEAIIGALGAAFIGSAVLYVGIHRKTTPPKTLSPEWRALSAQYYQHNNADPIYQHPK